MTDLIVEVSHLSKSFGENKVLNDISFILNKGENLVVLGRSGSGKSVLIKCIIGLIHKDRGEVNLLGKNIETLNSNSFNELRKSVGFLFQSSALYDSMSVRENLEFPLRAMKNNTSESVDNLIIEALQHVGLEDAIDKMPSELSGGMRKRIALARAIILKPTLILYDEPTTGLDPITSREISHLILDIQQKFNTSSIIITHDMACAKIAANRMIMIDEGKIKAEGDFEQLSKSEDQWVRAFFE
jgi:phospholipid/cholesterol/gamma-HCH transport system ATP-binding protein